jgi:tetratricopeptide (TPR) repeat protein
LEEGAGPEASEYREVGYNLYDRLMAERQEAPASSVLRDLADLAFDALEEARRKGPPPARLLNEVAWYCALRGERLGEALALADEAVRRTAPGEKKWPWHVFFGKEVDRQSLGMYLNTRGWIELRLRDDAAALRDLEDAARVYPAASNFLYLGLARFALNQVDAARAAVREAREAGHVSPYEMVLLEDLERDLGET